MRKSWEELTEMKLGTSLVTRAKSEYQGSIDVALTSKWLSLWVLAKLFKKVTSMLFSLLSRSWIKWNASWVGKLLLKVRKITLEQCLDVILLLLLFFCISILFCISMMIIIDTVTVFSQILNSLSEKKAWAMLFSWLP